MSNATIVRVCETALNEQQMFSASGQPIELHARSSYAILRKSLPAPDLAEPHDLRPSAPQLPYISSRTAPPGLPQATMPPHDPLEIGDKYYTLSDHRYGVKEGVELWLRVWSPKQSVVEAAPWLFWIHGGGYRAGHHFSVPPCIVNLFGPRGYHIVSVGYRLTPYVDMECMVQDCHDALTWCRERMGGSHVLAGSSAGGGLATLLAPRVMDHPPKAVICINGAVDMVNLAAIQAKRKAPAWTGAISESEVAELSHDHDPSHAVIYCSLLDDIVNLKPDSDSDSRETAVKSLWRVPDEAWITNEYTRRQSDVNKYLGAHGQIVNTPLRITKETSAEQAQALMEKYSINYLFNDNLFPPTFLLHGTDDVIVPVQQSKELAEKLRASGIDVEEVYIPGAGHGCFRPYNVSAQHSSADTSLPRIKDGSNTLHPLAHL